MATESLLRLPEVMRLTGLSRSTVYLGVTRGWFPAPIKLCPDPTARAVGWNSCDIDAWIVERIERSGKAST